MPETAVDATVVGRYIATALQTIVSRSVSPLNVAALPSALFRPQTQRILLMKSGNEAQRAHAG
ncbi:hypothetical protein QNH14_09495 [Apirhabdus apintestini]|nr:hypothetical protein QNH14_09495 [Enterobacteriaceae bacterium CA-0114]